MQRTAIVILNWNGVEMLRKFLPSVVRWSESDDTSVYVADNGSTDQSVAVIGSQFPSVKVIRLNDNYGFAEGYNRALAQIEAEYVVLLNSDVEVTAAWLNPMVEYMDEHQEVAACQPKILSYYHKEKFEYAGAAGGFIDKFGYPFCRGRIMSAVEKDNGQYDSIIPIFWATGAALFIRLEEYKKAGGLDPRFFAHMEEIDLCWRLHARGKGVVCVPQSVVYHAGAGTLKKENPRKTFLNFRNNLLMLYKNLPEKELPSVMRARYLLDYLAALSFLMKGQLPNAKAVWMARKEFMRICPDFRPERQVNIDKTKVVNIPERTGKSILLQYYLNGKKYFSRLTIKNRG